MGIFGTNKGNNLSSSSGNNSTTVQIANAQIGVSYSEVKEIALDVFNANFIKLRDQAAQLALDRAEELLDNFLKKADKELEGNFKSLSDPGVQSSVFNAQKEYAKSGDKELQALLVDLLINRVKTEDRSLLQIGLDEALTIAPKLTEDQLNILSIVFLFKWGNLNFESYRLIEEIFKKFILPFSNLPSERIVYEHLAYTGVATLRSGLINIIKIEDFIFDRFGNNLFKEFPPGYFIDEARKKGYIGERTVKCEKIKNHILQKYPQLEGLFNLWNENGNLFSVEPTSVGIILAQANIEKKIGFKFDLELYFRVNLDQAFPIHGIED